MNGKRILVWGSGAIGGTIGGHLARAGRDVTFVDLNTDHVEKIAAGRLRIDGPGIDFTTGGRAATPDTVAGTYDLILLAVKIQDTEAAARALRPHLADGGCVVSCQNGLASRTVGEIVGRERTLAAAMFLPAEWIAPGHITYDGRASLHIGELDGRRTERLDRAVEIFRDFNPGVTASDDIYGNIWGKMAVGIAYGVSSLTNEPRAEFFSRPERRPLVNAVIREMLRIGLADGYRAHDASWFRASAFLANDAAAMAQSIAAYVALIRNASKAHSGYWRDLAIRKRPTELPAQFMPAVEIADRNAVPAPLAKRFLAILAEVEGGRREIGTALVEELMALADSPAVACA